MHADRSGSRTRKAWESMELGKQEEAPAPLRVVRSERLLRHFMVPRGVGVHGCHPRVPLELSDECCGRTHWPLHNMEMAVVWPTTNASTTLFFLIPKKYHLGNADSVVANLTTMVGLAKISCCRRMEGTAQRHSGRLLQVCGRSGIGWKGDVG